MAYRQLPVDSSPNQNFNCTFVVDDQTVTWNFNFNYSEVAEYWVMDIKDGDIYLLSSIPLVPGDYPAANLLQQYKYKKMGSAYLINVSGTSEQWPSSSTLGTDWLLIWGDTNA